MSLIGVIFIVIALGIIAGAVLLIKQSAKKFNLTEEQLKDINQRNEAFKKEEQDEEK